MIDLGEQPSLQAAKEAFVAALDERGEDCIDDPVARAIGVHTPLEWLVFLDTACCGVEEAKATIGPFQYELATSFGH